MNAAVSTNTGEHFRFAPLETVDDFRRRNDGVDVYLIPGQECSIYAAGYAVSDRAIRGAMRLRYEVFNEELGEGLMSCKGTGLDFDEYDNQMSHLILIEKATHRVVGTYRIQVVTDALAGVGIYSARQYDLTALEPWFPDLVETGRACLARDHRSYTAVMHLWKGIAAFIRLHRKRFLFGCCSITSVDPDDGWRALRTLRQRNALHEKLLMPPTPAFSCGDPARETDPNLGRPIKIPKLFSAYLALGAKVTSLPAIDREFGTVDFLVLQDSFVVNYSPFSKIH
jgi:putative hemolysin